MIVMFEGSDCVGKSRLARNLLEHFQRTKEFAWLSPWHSPRPTQQDLCRQVRFFTDPLTMFHKDNLIILDRWWPSAPIYGSVFDGGTPLLPSEAWFMEALALTRGLLWVHVTAGVETVLDRLKNDPGDSPEWAAKQIRETPRLLALYNEQAMLASARGVDVLNVDTTADTEEDWIEIIARHAINFTNIANVGGMQQRGVGNMLTPKWLVIHHDHFRGGRMLNVCDYPRPCSSQWPVIGPGSDINSDSSLWSWLLRAGLAPAETAVFDWLDIAGHEWMDTRHYSILVTTMLRGVIIVGGGNYLLERVHAQLNELNRTRTDFYYPPVIQTLSLSLYDKDLFPSEFACGLLKAAVINAEANPMHLATVNAGFEWKTRTP